MCSKGSNTTTTQQTPSPYAMAAYQDVLGRAQGVANTPYQPYGGQLVAPVNQQQQTGIANVNANADYASPFVQQATAQAFAAMNPDQIRSYLNPFIQNAVNATQNQFTYGNNLALNQIKGNAIAQNALGGNREAIAESEGLNAMQTAQAPTIANMYQTGYQQAVQNSLQNAGLGLNAGQLGIAGQTAALQGAGAQIGAGTLEQQTAQAQDTAAQQQYAQGQAFPYQQASWLAGIDTGVGSNMGGTGTTTGPAPNPWSQIAGGLTSGVGLLGASGAFGPAGWFAPAVSGLFRTAGDGGVVQRAYGGGVTGGVQGFDAGGGVAPAPWGANGPIWGGATSWIPNYQMVHGHLPTPPSIPGINDKQNQQGLQGATKDLSNMMSGMRGPGFGGGSWAGGDAYGGSSQAPLEGLVPKDYGEGFARGGVAGRLAGGVSPDDDDDSPPADNTNGIPDEPETPAEQAAANGIAPPPSPDVVPMPKPRPAAAGVDMSGPDYNPNAISPGLMNRVQSYEGFNPHAYWDQKQYSIGYGTRANSPNETIDRAEGSRREESELQKAQASVDHILPANAPQHVRDALTSFTYNLGSGWTNGSLLSTAVQRGDYAKAAQLMQAYTHAGGQVSPGLVNRRYDEGQLMNGVETPIHASAFSGDANGQGDSSYPSEIARGYSANKAGASSQGVAPGPVGQGETPKKKGIDWGADSKLWPALTMAGAAMLQQQHGGPGSFGQALGAGLGAGENMYVKQQEMEYQRQKQAEEMDLRRQQLAQTGQAQKVTAMNQPVITGPDGKPMINPDYVKAHQELQRDWQPKLQPIGTNMRGDPVMGIWDPNTKKAYGPNGEAVTIDANGIVRPNPSAPPHPQSPAAATNPQAPAAVNKPPPPPPVRTAPDGSVNPQDFAAAAKQQVQQSGMPSNVYGDTAKAPQTPAPAATPAPPASGQTPIAPGGDQEAVQKTTPQLPPHDADSTAPAGTDAARNTKFLAEIAASDPGYATEIKKAADYELDPNIFSKQKNRQARFMADVFSYDNSFQPQEYGLRYRARAAYLPGTKNAESITSFNTAIQHLDVLKQLYNAVQNHDMRLINQIKNQWSSHISGLAEANDLNGVGQLVAGEVVKASVGAQNALGDREELRKAVDANLSKAQSASIIDKFQKIMAGKLDSIEFAYKQSTHLDNFQEQFLMPRSRQILNQLRQQGGVMPDLKNTSDAAGSAPAAAQHPEGAVGTRKAKDGSIWYVDKNGKPLGQQ